MNPFDLKTVLLAKHAQHAAMVHFPIALIVVSVAFDLIALSQRSQALLRAANYTTITAAISAVPTVATGVLARQLQFEGKAPHGNLKLHMSLALISSGLIFLVCWLQVREKQNPRAISPGLRLTVEVLTVALTLLTGHVGGFVSGVNGPA